MRQLLIFFLRIYRYGVSPLLGPRCRFYPSCSCYAQTALELHGVWRGSWLAIRRLSRCHPWHPGGVDPVPEPLAREKGLKAEVATTNCRQPGCGHGDHGDAETVQRDY